MFKIVSKRHLRAYFKFILKNSLIFGLAGSNYIDFVKGRYMLRFSPILTFFSYSLKNIVRSPQLPQANSMDKYLKTRKSRFSSSPITAALANYELKVYMQTLL